MKKKLSIILILVAAMVLLCCGAALADSGKCGDNVTWGLNASGDSLYILGTGKMMDYSSSTAPWYGQRAAIKTVSIDDGVTNIGNYAFFGCTGLTSVKIPKRVTRIGDSAFEGCTTLASIEIPKSVTQIGLRTFHDCASLTSVIIPDRVTSIGNEAFTDCSRLTSLTIMNYNCTFGQNEQFPFVTASNTLVLRGYTGSTAEIYATERGIAFESLGTLPVNGFCGDHLTWMFNSITGTLTIRGTGNMSDFSYNDAPWYNRCLTLKTVVIEEGVTSIGNGAFNGCICLTSVTIADSVISIGDGACAFCNGLNSIEIPYSVTSIGFGAFSNCTGLASVVILNFSCVFKNDEPGVFEGCSASLVIKGYTGSTTEIFAISAGFIFEALSSCGTCGDNVYWAFDSSTGTLTISGTGNMTDYAIGDPTNGIAYGIYDPPWYQLRTSITTLVIEDGVTNIGAYAFPGCTGLTNIEIPGSVTSIGALSFNCCAGLTNIEIPDSVTSIGDGAFFFCTGLNSIEIPDSVTSIGGSLFYGCISLTNMTIPNSVSVIGNQFFYGCNGLTSVTIPNSVASIGYYAFSGCTSLASVTIPGSVIDIGEYSFFGCTGLTSVTILNPSCNIGYDYYNVFADCSTSLVLRGQLGSTVQTYAAAAGITFEPLDVPAPTFILPNKLKKIPNKAFSKIAAKAVLIPASVASISGNPFAGSAVRFIYGVPGTAAETLAADYGYLFIAIEN